MSGTPALLEVEDLKVHFPVRTGLLGRSRDPVRAVDGVSFSIERGETLALVGESGCGKSTTGYAVIGMEPPTSGAVRIDGLDRRDMDAAARRSTMRRLQIVFQDPASALNPRMRVGDCIAEPLVIHGQGNAAQRAQRVGQLLDLVGLPASSADKVPGAFSGGQRQRVVIARALALQPDLVVCDEAVSALDVSIQSQIMNLLLALQAELALSYLFISHDLAVVHHIADRVAVMYFGRIVEIGPVDEVFAAPAHPYTRALLDAVPRPNPAARVRRKPRRLAGEPPSPTRVNAGCPFSDRCPHVEARCRTLVPELTRVGPDHTAACIRLPQPAGSRTASGT